MNRFLRTALVLAIFACASSLLIVTASAQSVYGSIFGTVSDKSGAVIPNATVTVTDDVRVAGFVIGFDWRHRRAGEQQSRIEERGLKDLGEPAPFVALLFRMAAADGVPRVE